MKTNNTVPPVYLFYTKINSSVHFKTDKLNCLHCWILSVTNYNRVKGDSVSAALYVCNSANTSDVSSPFVSVRFSEMCADFNCLFTLAKHSAHIKAAVLNWPAVCLHRIGLRMCL